MVGTNSLTRLDPINSRTAYGTSFNITDSNQHLKKQQNIDKFNNAGAAGQTDDHASKHGLSSKQLQPVFSHNEVIIFY
jgi:hypothetical protein